MSETRQKNVFKIGYNLILINRYSGYLITGTRLVLTMRYSSFLIQGIAV